MADSANNIYKKIFFGGWQDVWCKQSRRSIKRKFDRVSREEISDGVSDGKYDEAGVMERNMFFDGYNSFNEGE